MKLRFGCFALCCLVFFALASLGQDKSSNQAHPEQQNAQQQQNGAAGNYGTQANFGSQLAKTSREAAGHAEGEEKDEKAEFKQSASVKAVSRWTGLSLDWAYRLSILLNFVILAGLIILFSKSKLPAMFRTRTYDIQRGIREAQKASDDANKRLAEIESRLAKLDSEVAVMREAADAESVSEEERIRQATESDKKKIVEGAQSEIAAAAKLARGELKAYAAELAVSLAEKKIRIDADTDKALVGNFVAQLTGPGTPGKDGR